MKYLILLAGALIFIAAIGALMCCTAIIEYVANAVNWPLALVIALSAAIVGPLTYKKGHNV